MVERVEQLVGKFQHFGNFYSALASNSQGQIFPGVMGHYGVQGAAPSGARLQHANKRRMIKPFADPFFVKKVIGVFWVTAETRIRELEHDGFASFGVQGFIQTITATFVNQILNDKSIERLADGRPIDNGKRGDILLQVNVGFGGETLNSNDAGGYAVMRPVFEGDLDHIIGQLPRRQIALQGTDNSGALQNVVRAVTG